MTQKQFVIGLIENEIERDLTLRADSGEVPTESEKATDDFEAKDVDKDEELDDEQDASEDQGMLMGM